MVLTEVNERDLGEEIGNETEREQDGGVKSGKVKHASPWGQFSLYHTHYVIVRQGLRECAVWLRSQEFRLHNQCLVDLNNLIIILLNLSHLINKKKTKKAL